MKNESQKQRGQDGFFLATEIAKFLWREPYRIQKQIIEMENFVPEAFVIHHLQRQNRVSSSCCQCTDFLKGEGWMPEINMSTEWFPRASETDLAREPREFYAAEDDEEKVDEDDEDWDEDDDEDEDWDEDDEEWDEDDEDWDEDEDEEEWDEDEDGDEE